MTTVETADMVLEADVIGAPDAPDEVCERPEAPMDEAEVADPGIVVEEALDP